MLRSRIIEEFTGLKVHETKVLNPECALPEAFWQTCGLDVVLEDKPAFYDLEMQVSGYTQKEQLRFQRIWLPPGRKTAEAGGDEYTELKPFYQIIFMNDKPKDGGRMIRHYKVRR